MSKKHDIKKVGKAEPGLASAESDKLEIIVDRLSVQNPEGESFESFLRSLDSSLAGQEDLVAALMERLSRNPSEVGFQVFRRLMGLVKSKQNRRVVKQAAYRFEQRGFSEAKEPLAGEKVVLIPRETRDPLAYMSPFAGHLWLVSALIPASGYPEPAAILALGEPGLRRVNVNVSETSFKLYRDYIRSIGETLPKPCEVPIWHAARLFMELMEFCGGQDDGPPELRRARQLFQPYYDPRKQPYAYQLMPQPEDPQREPSEAELKEIMEEVDVTPLVFSKDDLLPYRETIEDLDHPVLVVPKEIQTERALDVARRAADELWVGKTRLLYQRFFEEQAMWLKVSSKENVARRAWAVAQHLGNTSRASDSSVVVKFVILSMRRHWPEDFDKKTEGHEPEPYHLTDSGLILPR